ncbi:anti-sigma factor family protein [Herbaspirillum autotrophicum]|uniref:anti-sigma factor family protein n=1 Tax=Herbaspirillum autotrophicum TaxID=180195 RepID=UPI00067E2FD0|nr:anti-sigma factor [Herbaspirillum autotrophicum]
MNKMPITDADLHAYVDGLLSADRLADVSEHLQQHPEQAARLRSFRQQNQALHLLFDPVLDEAVPPRLAKRPRSGWQLLQQYAALLIVAVGAGVGGWYLHAASQSPALAWLGMPADASLRMARQAAVAHVVYSGDARRPVEIDGQHEELLVKWLSKRLGTELHAPKLATQGYELIGGRLLPGQSGPVAQFMYQHPDGQRLTLYVSTEQVQNHDTGFRFAQEGKVNVFYWIDGAFGYALSGSISKSELARIADTVYAQLEVQRK